MSSTTPDLAALLRDMAAGKIGTVDKRVRLRDSTRHTIRYMPAHYAWCGFIGAPVRVFADIMIAPRVQHVVQTALPPPPPPPRCTWDADEGSRGTLGTQRTPDAHGTTHPDKQSAIQAA